jgi:hypothetical protein
LYGALALLPETLTFSLILMTHWYKTSRIALTWPKLALVAGLLGAGGTSVQAQDLNYNAFGTQNTKTSYTDLGTTGTAIATANTDDANSAATAIGFTFSYNGASFTQFVLNTNGFIKLGNQAPSAANLYFAGPTEDTGDALSSENPADVNVLAPFNHDLVAGTSPAEYRVSTTGAAGSRVCTIQWKNVSDKLVTATTGKQYANLEFQVKLYEGTNTIDFVYGSSVAGPGPNALKTAAVGIKGSGSSETQLVTVTKASSTPWDQATFLTGNYTGNTHNFRRTVLPDAGRTYRFRAVAATDAAVVAVYSLGELPIPAGAPHIIRAAVRNVGTSALANVVVTATVAGANTFTSTKTIPSVPVGAVVVVAFDPFTPTVVGTETITVTAADDNINSNNVSTYDQVVNTTTYGVAELTKPVTGSAGITVLATGDAASGIFAVRYTTSVNRLVTGITVDLEDENSIGRTVYAVVCNSSGTIIGRTPDYVIQDADISTLKTFSFTPPVSIAPGDFLAGFAQAESPVGTPGYYPLGLQEETPTRPDTFYQLDLTGGGLSEVTSLGRFLIEAITEGGCTPPSSVFITPNATTAQVVFTGDTNASSYSIIYGPTGFNPASAGTTVTATSSPVTLTGLTPSTTYQVYLRTNCGASEQSPLTGPFRLVTLCTPTTITAFPYIQNFDDVAEGTLPCGISVANTNADTETWTNRSSVPADPSPADVAASAPNALTYYYNEDQTTAANDWFYTPALLLRNNTRYQLSFKYLSSGNYQEKLEVKYGASASPSGQTTTLWSDEDIKNPTYLTADANSTQPVLAIQPAVTGTYYIGFHVFSAADKFFLAVDDLQVTATPVTGTSAALDYAISVFPNPSTGIVSLDIKGAKAKGQMQVEVMNSLGQIVHTASVRDNQLNKLDLSNLAGGMYILKVKSGNDFSVRNLSIQK